MDTRRKAGGRVEHLHESCTYDLDSGRKPRGTEMDAKKTLESMQVFFELFKPGTELTNMVADGVRNGTESI